MLMTAPLTDLTVQVADLLDRPGASREVDFALPVPDDFDLPLADVAEPVALRGVIESVVDGLLVRGELRAEIGLLCARCLQAVQERGRVEVVELFADPSRVDPDDEVEDGYEIAQAALHLGALVRDALATAIPYQPRCDDDCKGLCAHCGADLNATACGCADVDHDPRWEGLRGLRLPE